MSSVLKPLLLTPLLVAGSLLLNSAQAAEPRFNQVSLRAQASTEVPHDLMSVTLYSEERGAEPNVIAEKVTAQLNQAVTSARKVEGIKISMGNRNSYPVYGEKNQEITAWQERGEVRLESKDFTALSQLTGELLKELKMGGMQFAIAPETRREHEDKLLAEAISAFKARAKIATDALGGKSYKVVNLNLNTSNFPTPPMYMRAASAKYAMSEAADIPQVEGGNAQVTLSADGVIEVQ